MAKRNGKDEVQQRSMLREAAPQIRTVEVLQRKLEQVFDASAHNRITPGRANGQIAILKQIKALNLDLPYRLALLRARFRDMQDALIPPSATMLREMIQGKPALSGRRKAAALQA